MLADDEDSLLFIGGQAAIVIVTPIVIIGFLLLLLPSIIIINNLFCLQWESVAAPGIIQSKVVRFGTLQDSLIIKLCALSTVAPP